MGTWDVGIFDNDAALDWVGELSNQEGTAQINAALDDVLDTGGEYLEGDLSNQALAAIEALTLSYGAGDESACPEALRDWVVENNSAIDSALLEKSLRVIDRILTEPSENLRLFDGDLLEQWKGVALTLRARVAGLLSK